MVGVFGQNTTLALTVSNPEITDRRDRNMSYSHLRD
jgi:membrane-associated PAP2 superfamily phosphatase